MDLARSAERFRQVAENSREWIWELDPEGRYTFCSPIVVDILGYEAGVMVGKHFMELVDDASKDEVQEALEHALKENKPILRLRHKQVTRDGQTAILETSGLPVLDPERNLLGYRGAHRDLTQEVETEEQLRQAQKMEAIGQLAGGVAHHYNNLLTVILGCADLLKGHVGDDEVAQGEIEQIKEAGDTAASLTRQLLAFSRRQMLLVRRININTALTDVDLLLRSTLGDDIELVTKFEPHLEYVNADGDQVKHAVLRLAINARGAIKHAMTVAHEQSGEAGAASTGEEDAKPGQLILETANVELSTADCKDLEGVEPGAFVMLSVSDTGVGMPAEVREHIFEPFFTTQAVGEGSGLGLSSVYGAMRQMNGAITVESVEGSGTTFKLYFPVAAEEPPSEASSKAS
jgi:PAS domain S-box-containing protein